MHTLQLRNSMSRNISYCNTKKSINIYIYKDIFHNIVRNKFKVIYHLPREKLLNKL